MSWATVAAVAKTALNNRILTRRLKSKQHEEISKAEPSPLSHAFETTVQNMSDEAPFVQAEQRSKAQERHWLPICLFIQPRDGDWTNSPFPLKLDQTGVCRGGEGCCRKWREEREDLSWEKGLEIKAVGRQAKQRSEQAAGLPQWLYFHNFPHPCLPLHPPCHSGRAGPHSSRPGHSELFRWMNQTGRVNTKPAPNFGS